MESWNILEILPPEVMVLVFSNLEPEDIVSSLSVSKLWNALHSGFNWKEAFLMTFGELSSSSVDVTRKFNWRKLFFDRKTLSVMARRYKVKLLLKFNSFPSSGRFHIKAVTRDNVICTLGNAYYNVDLRPFKTDPSIQKDKIIPSAAALSIEFNFFQYTKTIQNNIIVRFSAWTKVNERQISVQAFWNPAKGTKAIPTFVPPRSNYYASRIHFNTKYLLWSSLPNGCLIDTSKSCHHYCNFEKKGQIYERENFPITCDEAKCAIIDTWSDFYWFPFLSAEDPDLLVGIKAKKEGFELVISRIGQKQKIEMHIAQVITSPDLVKIGSEHVIRSRKKIVKHWFSFEINNELYFIDLMDTTRKVKTAVVSKYDWIPNESKVVLQNKNILIVFDLETATRCSKLTFKTTVIQDFSILPNRGFIAVLENDGNSVTICQWETGMKARSIDVTEYEVTNILLASPDLLLLWNDYHLYYVQLYPSNQPHASIN